MVWLYIYFISDFHNGWTKYKNDVKQELSVFSSEFRPSLKDIITIKFFYINSQLNETEKKH